jgi:hypothetical protein
MTRLGIIVLCMFLALREVAARGKVEHGNATAARLVEIEMGVLRGQWLDRRIGERELLIAEVKA